MISADKIPRVDQYREILRKRKAEECRKVVYESKSCVQFDDETNKKLEIGIMMENKQKIDKMSDLELFQDYLETLTVEEMNGTIFLLHNFMDGKDYKIADIGEMIFKLTFYKKLSQKWLLALFYNKEKKIIEFLKEHPFEEGIFYLLVSETCENLLKLDKNMELLRKLSD